MISLARGFALRRCTLGCDDVFPSRIGLDDFSSVSSYRLSWKLASISLATDIFFLVFVCN